MTTIPTIADNRNITTSPITINGSTTTNSPFTGGTNNLAGTTLSPPGPSGSPLIALWIAIGVIVFLLIMVMIIIILVLLLINRRRRKNRFKLQSNVDGESLHPVKYKAKPKQEPVQTQGSIAVTDNLAYGSAYNLDEGVDSSEEYVEVPSGQPLEGGDDYYEEVTKESLQSYDDDDCTYTNTTDEFFQGRHRDATASPGTKKVPGSSTQNKGNLQHPDSTSELLQESSKDSDKGKIDLGPSKARRGRKQGVPTPSKGGKMKKEECSLTSHRKNDPNYVNDLDEIAREIAKADLGIGALGEKQNAPKTKKQPVSSSPTAKKGPGYVNDLHTLVQQQQQQEQEEWNKEDTSSNEDEEGYTVFDPKRSTVRGKLRRCGEDERDADGGEEGIYQNSIVELEQRKIQHQGEIHTSSPTAVTTRPTEGTQDSNTIQEQHVDAARPYVNDLQKAVQEAQEKEKKTGKHHHPYVNDVAGLVQRALIESQKQGGDHSAELGVGGAAKERLISK